MSITVSLATSPERAAYYAEMTGLSPTRVRALQRRPTSEWKRSSNRMISAIIRVLEGLWEIAEITATAWLRLAELLLPIVAEMLEVAAGAASKLYTRATAALYRFIKRHEPAIRAALLWLAKEVVDILLAVLEEKLRQLLGLPPHRKRAAR